MALLFSTICDGHTRIKATDLSKNAAHAFGEAYVHGIYDISPVPCELRNEPDVPM